MNRVIYLKQTPEAELRAEHFELREEADPSPAQGQVLVRNLLMSIDAVKVAFHRSFHRARNQRHTN